MFSVLCLTDKFQFCGSTFHVSEFPSCRGDSRQGPFIYVLHLILGLRAQRLGLCGLCGVNGTLLWDTSG